MSAILLFWYVIDCPKTVSHRITASEDGDYMFCLENTFSRFSEKLVFFELITDEDDIDGDIFEDSDYQMDSRYEMKVEDFRVCIA